MPRPRSVEAVVLHEDLAQRLDLLAVAEGGQVAVDVAQATFLMKVTYNAAPGPGSCTLCCITYSIGSASEGTFDIERADLYTDRQAAEEAWTA